MATAPLGIGVLEATPPAFSAEEAAAVAERLFGVAGAARDLGSERDQTFLIEGGSPEGVMKISNLGEDPAVLDLETRGDAAHRAHRPDPAGGAAAAAAGRAARTALPRRTGPPRTAPGGPPRAHVRAHRRPLGHDGRRTWTTRALAAFGATLARLGRALRGFFHPAAGRVLLWDIGHASGLRPLTDAIPDPYRRAIVGTGARPLRRSASRRPGPACAPRSSTATSTLDNVLARRARPGGRDHRLRRHDPHGPGRPTSPPRSHRRCAAGPATMSSATARLVIDGYASVTPLEPDERGAARRPAWRRGSPTHRHRQRLAGRPLPGERRVHPGLGRRRVGAPASGSTRSARTPWRGELGAAGRAARRRPSWPRRRRRGARRGADRPDLRAPGAHRPRRGRVAVRRRRRAGCSTRTTTCPSSGTATRASTEAVVRADPRAQHARPLPLRGARSSWPSGLSATMPRAPASTRCMLVNSGSEANDLAWRLATALTGDEGGDRHRLRLPRGHGRDRRPLARGVAGGLPPATASRRSPPAGRGEARCAGAVASGSPTRGLGPHRRRLPRHRVHERRRSSPRRRPTSQALVGAPHAAGGAASWRTRCRPATAAAASICGRSRRTASRRTSSRWASRWATATRSRRW